MQICEELVTSYMTVRLMTMPISIKGHSICDPKSNDGSGSNILYREVRLDLSELQHIPNTFNTTYSAQTSAEIHTSWSYQALTSTLPSHGWTTIIVCYNHTVQGRLLWETCVCPNTYPLGCLKHTCQTSLPPLVIPVSMWEQVTTQHQTQVTIPRNFKYSVSVAVPDTRLND